MKLTLMNFFRKWKPHKITLERLNANMKLTLMNFSENGNRIILEISQRPMLASAGWRQDSSKPFTIDVAGIQVNQLA